MRLTDEQESILRGNSGQAMAQAMETIIRYGEAFAAEHLTPIVSGHLAGTFGVSILKTYYEIIDKLASEGARFRVPVTTNPRPGEKINLINRAIFRKQAHLDRQLLKLGATPNYSCVCYQEANVPARGDVLAWAESSAVVWANSVIGARTNRNSVLIDLCSALTGFTPEFGYLKDANRKGGILVKHNIKKMDAPALGYLIGRLAVDKVPVIEHYPFSEVELKNMGGAMAASGGVAMFHIEGLTPEAPDIKSAFDADPAETVTIDQAGIDRIRTADPQACDLIVFGCPQMTYEEAMQIAPHFQKAALKKKVWFCMVPADLEKMKTTDTYAKLIDAGVAFHPFCPTIALTLRLKNRKVLTNSGKMHYYLSGAAYGNLEDCISAAGGMA